jgi:hypothetical protein
MMDELVPIASREGKLDGKPARPGKRGSPQAILR